VVLHLSLWGVVGLLLVVVAFASYWVYRMEELRYSLMDR